MMRYHTIQFVQHTSRGQMSLSASFSFKLSEDGRSELAECQVKLFFPDKLDEYESSLSVEKGLQSSKSFFLSVSGELEGGEGSFMASPESA